MAARRPTPAAPPEPAPDPLADLRDGDDGPPIVIPPTGGKPTQHDAPPPLSATPGMSPDGQPMTYLDAAETTQEAVDLAFIQVAADLGLSEVIGAELLQRLGVLQTLPAVQVANHSLDGAALISEAEQVEIRGRMIEVWHNDTVAQQVVHKGGVCLCRYLAQAVVQVILPAAPDEEPEPVTDLGD